MTMRRIGRVRLTAALATAGDLPAGGRLRRIAENEALHWVLGTRSGGDGETTFGLPDLHPITPNGLTYSVCAYGVFPQG